VIHNKQTVSKYFQRIKNSLKRPDRVEYKYLIPNHIISFVQKDVEMFSEFDLHSASKPYFVSSTYFDNHRLQSYHEKLAGDNKRIKLRIRRYSKNADTYFVEFKIKNSGNGVKIKKTINKYQYDRLLKRDLSFLVHGEHARLEDNLLFSMIKLEGYRPLIEISYQRSAMVSSSDSNIRITFDTDIFCSRISGFSGNISTPLLVLDNKYTIMEIKGPHYFPSWLDMVLNKYDLKKAAVSKYTMSVQRLASNSTLSHHA
jgi:SPX domain protein involved in polyphosphate accumulation